DRHNNRIRMVNAAGIIITLTGGGSGGFRGEGGPASSAQIWDPRGVAVDNGGNVFIADSGNNRIRMINAAGIITTVVGNTPGFSGDGGAAASAQLGLPVDVAVDSGGNLFIADRGNYRVRQVNSAGVITSVAGIGDDGGPALAAQLNYPNMSVMDTAGNLFVAETDNQRIRKVTPWGTITTIAGNGRDRTPRSDLADPLIICFGDEQIARGIHNTHVRVIELGCQSGTAIVADSGNRSDYTGRVDLTDSVVAPVRDEEIAAAIDGNIDRKPELGG